MDRLGAARLRRSDDLLTNQIGFARRRRPDVHDLVGLTHMQRLGVSIRIDRNGPYAHLARGADDTAGDLAAIGEEEGLDHCHGHTVLRGVKWILRTRPENGSGTRRESVGQYV